jgi:hypothetical protein
VSAAGQQKERCKRGHDLTGANVYTRPGKPKHRECRACRLDSARKRVKGPVPRSDEWRFFSRVELDDGGCWRFATVDENGYGRFWVDCRQQRAHRWLYQWMVAELPPSLQLDHLCRNRACVNPDHLDPVTGQVNTGRGETLPAANAAKARCPAGHPYEGRNLRLNNGRRVCRACHRINAAAYRQRRAAA